jgi:hypothetical protein
MDRGKKGRGGQRVLLLAILQQGLSQQTESMGIPHGHGYFPGKLSPVGHSQYQSSTLKSRVSLCGHQFVMGGPRMC